MTAGTFSASIIALLSMTPVGGKSMTRLELLHGDDDRGIVFARNALADEIAGHFESPLQDCRLPGRADRASWVSPAPSASRPARRSL